MSPAAARKPRLYLADDSRSMRSFYRMILEEEFDVEVFDDGEPLLQAALAALPDVVVSDVQMPQMDGLELVRQLKAHPHLASVPVILLTADDGGEGGGTAVESLNAGADDFLKKPVTREELLARVNSAHRSFLAYEQLRQKHEELAEAYRKLGRMELELRHAHKLKAIGQLAAGVAHECNTPLQFIADGLGFAREGVAALCAALEKYRGALTAAGDGAAAALAAELRGAEQALDLDFVLEELPRSLELSLQGTRQVSEIVRSLKEFAGEGDGAPGQRSADVRALLGAALEAARPEYEGVAEVETDCAELPPLLCEPLGMQQAFAHVLSNAAHAVADANRAAGRERGSIRVQALRAGEWLEVRIADTGTGIAPEIRERVFEPFFTTRAVGTGSGQGLALAHAAITKHGGSIRFESEVGRGTTFFIRLPLAADAPAAAGKEA